MKALRWLTGVADDGTWYPARITWLASFGALAVGVGAYIAGALT